MRTIDLEIAIREFLDASRKIGAESEAKLGTVVDLVIEFYQDTRITGAQLDEDGDMLLFQWGSTKPLKLTSPTDLRGVLDEDIDFEESEHRYIDFTRQVFLTTEGEDSEFDDAAVQMSLTLLFGAATGDELLSNLWIEDLDSINSQSKAFRNEPFVQGLWNEASTRMIAIVQYCG